MSVGFIIQGVVSIFGLAAMIFLAVTALENGRGMQTYYTVWLVEENWISFLVFFGCAIGALVLGAAFRFRNYLQWRRFEKRLNDQSKNG
jgi:uncharacterized integral membrane protein